MKSVFANSFIVATLVTLVGCSSKFAGEIEFHNSSSTDLWVDVSGFDRRVRCGALGAGVSATTVLDSSTSTALPNEVLLTWNYVGSPKQDTKVTIPEDARRMKKGTLLFEFDAQGQWSARYKP